MNPIENVREGGSMTNQPAQSRAGTSRGHPPNEGRGQGRPRVNSEARPTLTERVNTQQEELTMLRQEIMAQFQQLNTRLNVGQPQTVMVAPLAPPTQQAGQTQGIQAEGQGGGARDADDHQLDEGQRARPSEQRNEVVREGTGAGHQSEQAPTDGQERIIERQLDQTTESRSVGKGKHSKVTSK